MTTMLDPRVDRWLEAGPDSAPPVAFEEIMRAVAETAQEPRRARVGGRVLPVTRSRLLLAAAVVVAAVATGAYLLRDSLPDVATPREPGLLSPFPGTRSIIEREGGPATADESLVITSLAKGSAYVVVASCTGGGTMTADVWDRTVEWGPDVPEAERLPGDRLPVTCDGAPASMRVVTLGRASDDNEVVLEVPAGATWRAAVGEVTDVPSAPTFPALETGDGALVLIDLPEPVLAHTMPGGGIAIQVPAGVTTVTALLQCLGDPVVVSVQDGPTLGTADCTDPAVTNRFDMPAVDGMAVLAGSDGLAWVRLAAEAVPAEASLRPGAPALPDGLGEVRFAEGDGSNVAFGTLGGSTQTVITTDATPVGSGAGDVVVMGRRNGTATGLELWRMSDATSLGTIATVADGSAFGAWIDPTHEQVFYGVLQGAADDAVAAWHRVGFDGTGDEVLATVPAAGITFAQQELAADGSVFVAQWCVATACRRAIHDTATGRTREVALDGDVPCELLGVADGRIVVRTPACDASTTPTIVVQDLDGGESTVIHEGAASGGVVATTAGPRVVLVANPDETHTTVSVIGLDGTEPREAWATEHEPGFDPRLSPVRLPAGDWLLLAGPLGDTPGARGTGRPMPVLLNLVTGKRIELPNLPHS